MIEEITEMMIEPATAELKEATSSPSGTEPPAPSAAMWSVSQPVSESIAPLTTRANSPKVMM